MARECVLVQAGPAADGPTGLTYASGVSAMSTGAEALCLQLASLPPATRGKAHRHDEHESAAYMLEGDMIMWYGDALEHQIVVRAGDFVYIPSGVPHLVQNASNTEPALAVLARTDPAEQESVVELPGLDSLPHLLEWGRE